jgi:hypothetical protein
VFSNPVKILQWILPLIYRTQRVLFFHVPACKITRRLPGGVSSPSTKHSAVLFSCALMHSLDAHLAELSQNPHDSASSSNSQQSSFLCALLYTRSIPTWKRSKELLRDYVSCLNSQQSSSNYTLCLCSMPTWQSLYRTPQIFYLLSSNSQQSSFSAPLCICSMPTWQSSTEFTAELCLQLCLLPHSLASKVFSNLEVFTPLS